ncbi:putative bifunctional diguanylate cyclase/phosphodiesterase [Aquihabitans sp. McL0605]|uniref:putative bifunctional diguanylate cyclase/phosphodiesterase n=1 Tax=Aquihabitans sp. McL0605 TaxID=3415671 RepID=UPI003CF56A6F
MGDRSGVKETITESVRELRRPLVDIGEDGFLHPLFLQRYAGIAALAIGAVVFGSLPEYMPVLIIAVGFSANAFAHHHAKRTGQAPIWMHLTDMLGVLVFPALSTEIAVPAVLVMLAVVSLAACVSGLGPALLCSALGVVGLVLINTQDPLPEAGLLIGGFAIASLMIATAVGQLAAVEDRVRRRLNTVVDNLDAILWVRNPADDRFTFVNQRATTMLGWTQDEWLQPGFWLAHLHPADADATTGAVGRAVALGIDHEVSYRFRASDGRWVHLHDRVTVSVDGAGAPTALQGMSIDISDRVQIEHRVNQYADIVDRIDQALIVLRLEESDDEGEVLRLRAANPAAERLMRRDLYALIGSSVEDAFPALVGSRLRDRLAGVVDRGVPLRVDDLIVQPVGGEQRVVTLRAFPLPDRSVAMSLQDITDAVAASEALRRQALYDGLTGLPNRRLFDQELHRAVRDAPGRDEQVALLVMDLDQFKEVNDALGHHVGDQLLRGIGDRLTREFDHALVARLGGDEFALVLSGEVTEASAREVAARIRDTLAVPFLMDDVRLQSNASIGIALFPQHADDVPTLIQRADVAMYNAKRSGTGSAVYAAEHDRSSVERLTLIGDLPDAVALDQFELHFQPCVDLRTGRPVRAEALIRWNHPRLGRINPDQFIELAELSGAIQPLTRWVLREGLIAAARWRAAGHPIGLAVNLSVRNLYDPELVPYVAQELSISEVPAADLVLELTETELMDDPSLAQEIFTQLGDLGVGTAIDDFGTGYSSLTYLRDLPLQEVKIDRSFVTEMHRRSEEFTIVRSMIDLGHNLGLKVVAEGVEHADDLVLLRRLGCDLAQGFHLAEPLPLDHLLKWLDGYTEAMVFPGESA